MDIKYITTHVVEKKEHYTCGREKRTLRHVVEKKEHYTVVEKKEHYTCGREKKFFRIFQSFLYQN